MCTYIYTHTCILGRSKVDITHLLAAVNLVSVNQGTEAPSLRTVLLKLGLAPEELAGQHCDWPGVPG